MRKALNVYISGSKLFNILLGVIGYCRIGETLEAFPGGCPTEGAQQRVTIMAWLPQTNRNPGGSPVLTALQLLPMLYTLIQQSRPAYDRDVEREAGLQVDGSCATCFQSICMI